MKKGTNKLKILLMDMELSYALAYVFPSKHPQYISSRQIKNHQYCPCASYKFLEDSKPTVIKITDNKKRFKKNFRDDYIVAKALHNVMTEADVIVAHNGDAFDIKHANTLFIKHKLGPIPEKKSIDTLKVARRYFNFPGNDLDSLSKRFGGTGKDQKPCWFALTEGCEKEINKAAKYCAKDVMELQRVFINVRPYVRRLPHIHQSGKITECKACGSERMWSKGNIFYNNKIYRRVQCAECKHNDKQEIKK